MLLIICQPVEEIRLPLSQANTGNLPMFEKYFQKRICTDETESMRFFFHTQLNGNTIENNQLTIAIQSKS